MREADWLSCRVPRRMLRFLQDKASDRKCRLFTLACCRLGWPWLESDSVREAVGIAERAVAGLASADELSEADRILQASTKTSQDAPSWSRWATYRFSWVASRNISGAAGGAAGAATYWKAVQEARSQGIGGKAVGTRAGQASRAAIEAGTRAECAFLRDLFGPTPFRVVSFDPTCLTPTITAIARCIDEERRFGDLPVLADALEESGCDNPDILSHLREPGPHIPGCWALDLLLQKG